MRFRQQGRAAHRFRWLSEHCHRRVKRPSVAETATSEPLRPARTNGKKPSQEDRSPSAKFCRVVGSYQPMPLQRGQACVTGACRILELQLAHVGAVSKLRPASREEYNPHVRSDEKILGRRCGEGADCLRTRT